MNPGALLKVGESTGGTIRMILPRISNTDQRVTDFRPAAWIANKANWSTKSSTAL